MSSPPPGPSSSQVFHPELFERHPQPMWVYDLETLRVLAVNDRALLHYGYSREEFLALRIVDLRPAEEQPGLMRYLARTGAGLDDSGPWRHRRRDGTELLVEVSSHALEFGGRPARLVMAQDVTARATAEDRLRRAEALLRFSTRMARLGGWIYDLAAGQVEWSDEVCAIHEVPPGTTPSLAEALAFYPPESQPRLAQVLESCVADGTAFDEELEFVTAGGRRLWVRVMAEAVRGPDGPVTHLRGAFQDITDRKQAAQSLIQSDQRFRRFADAIPQIVWTADPGGQVDFMSRAFFDYAGVHGMEVKEAWMRAAHPDDAAANGAAWQHAMATGEDYRAEFRLRRAADRSWRWHLALGRPVRDQSGRIAKWYGSTIDVHDRREAEEAARRLAARLNTTLESISDGFYMLDRDWRYTFVNQEAERLLHRPRGALIGNTIWQAFPEAAGTELHRQYHKAMQEGQTSRFELHYPALDGWFDVSIYPSEEGLAVYFRDITERLLSQARIRDFQARFETLVDKAVIGILVHVDLKPVFVNRALAQMLGYRGAEEMLALDSVLALFAEGERERMTRYAADRLAGGGAPEVYSVRGQRRDGSTVELEIRPFPIEWAGRTAVCATLIDVTEQHAMEAQLRQAQRLEAVGQLTGGIAHDFNNLLTVILGNAELLAEAVAADPDLAHVAEMIEKAAGRGAELTSRLLAFARRQALNPKAIDAGQLLRGMEGLLRRALGEQIEIELVTQEGLWDALADAAQLESGLLNLCLNARDAMPDGGRLTVEAANVHLDQAFADRNEEVAAGEYVMVAVSDTGTGMPPEVVAHAFDPFFTTKEVGTGTGLGLSMVFGFVKQSRGHVRIHSQVGQGTTVKLYLPRASAEEERAGATRVRAGAPGGSEHILLVEDNELVRAHVAAQLRLLGYQVVVAASGSEAIAELSRPVHFDLLFTDVVMPGGMNGRRLADEAMRMRPGLPVLFTSGYSEDAIVHHGRLDRGLHFLNKPYRREELAAKLRQILAGTGDPKS